MTKRTTLTLATAAMALALQVSATSAANANAVEFFKCTMVEGASIDGLVEVANNFKVVAAENGLENINIVFLTPVYAADIAEGTFVWVGLTENLADAGRMNDIWGTDANADVRAGWDELVADCEASSLYNSTGTGGDGDEADGD